MSIIFHLNTTTANKLLTVQLTQNFTAAGTKPQTIHFCTRLTHPPEEPRRAAPTRLAFALAGRQEGSAS